MKETTVATVASLALLSAGCSRFVGQTETSADGRSVTRFRAFTLFDAHSELAKLSVTQSTTNKLKQSFGIGSFEQSSSASNAVTLFQLGADGALKILKP